MYKVFLSVKHLINQCDLHGRATATQISMTIPCFETVVETSHHDCTAKVDQTGLVGFLSFKLKIDDKKWPLECEISNLFERGGWAVHALKQP